MLDRETAQSFLMLPVGDLLAAVLECPMFEVDMLVQASLRGTGQASQPTCSHWPTKLATLRFAVVDHLDVISNS